MSYHNIQSVVNYHIWEYISALIGPKDLTFFCDGFGIPSKNLKVNYLSNKQKILNILKMNNKF